jgi:hypothetical protein
MPGKHAPVSARTFYLSLGRSVGGALAAVGIMVALVLVVLDGGKNTEAGSPAIDTSPRSSPSPTPSATTTPSPTASATPTILTPARVTVAVLNGTNRSGLAQRTADRIKEAGYPVVTVGNNSAPEETSTIFYRPDAREEAVAFQKRFPEFTALKESTQLGNSILRAVIGADFP